MLPKHFQKACSHCSNHYVRYTPPHLIFFGAVRNSPGYISHICRCMLIARLFALSMVQIYN